MSGREPEPQPGKTVADRVLGKEALRAPPPKRFYKDVSVGDRGTILLDGRAAKTPGKSALLLPTAAFAETVAEEWRAQGERIDPEHMPLTRIANTAIDAVAGQEAKVAADVVAFAGSDLLCYRAAGPEALVARQAAAWDPILAWARDSLGARFVLAEGVMPVIQPPGAIDRFAGAIAGLDPFRLSALHIMTTLSGSAILGVGVLRGHLSAEAAWAAAHVDEDWQIEMWGADAEAEARRAWRWREFQSAVTVLALV